MPDKKPIMLDEVVVTARRTNPKKYREVREKVSLYPKGSVDKYKIDSLAARGHGKTIGEPIRSKGQADMYGADQSDKIKKLLENGRKKI